MELKHVTDSSRWDLDSTLEDRARDNFRENQFIFSPNVNEEFQIIEGKSWREKSSLMLPFIKGLIQFVVGYSRRVGPLANGRPSLCT